MKRRTLSAWQQNTPEARALAICKKLTRDLSSGRVGGKIADRLAAEQAVQKKIDEHPNLAQLIQAGSKMTLRLAGF